MTRGFKTLRQMKSEKVKLENEIKNKAKLDSAIELYFITKKLFNGGFPSTELKTSICNLIVEAAKPYAGHVQIVPGIVWIKFSEQKVQKYTKENYKRGGKIVARMNKDGKWEKVKK